MEYHQLPDAAVPGRIRIANAAVEQIAAHTAAECYGVVGLGGRGGRVGQLIARVRPTRAIQVERVPEGLSIRLDVVVAHGLNLAEVAATVRSHVVYEVRRLTGLEVGAVEVRIGDVRNTG